MLYDLKKLDKIYQKGASCIGKTGKMAIKENTCNFKNLPKQEILLKHEECPDSKDLGFWDICSEISQLFPRN